jgi:hypothetical protein
VLFQEQRGSLSERFPTGLLRIGKHDPGLHLCLGALKLAASVSGYKTAELVCTLINQRL